MGITEVYTDAVHDNLPYFANADPGAPMEPGDYGVLNGDIFEPIGNVSDLGITIKTKRETKRADYEFKTEGVKRTDIGLGAGGQAGPIANLKAALKLDFSRENGVFFNAADCITEAVQNTDALGTALIKLYKEGRWKKKYAVVTHVVHAKATRVVVSRKAGTTISLEAEGEVAAIDLADAKLKLRPIDNSSSAVFTIVSTDGMTPLMKLFKVKPGGLFGHTTAGPALAAAPAAATRGGAKKATAKAPKPAAPPEVAALKFDEVE